MKKLIIAVMMLGFSLSGLATEIPQAVVNALLDESVSVVGVGGQGSGVLSTRNGITYCTTAGHVIADGRKTRTVVDAATKSTKTLVYFDDVQVVKEIVQNGRKVETRIAYAEVIRFSDADTGDDIAVLRLRNKGFCDSSVKFYLNKELPLVSSEIVHVGSIGGVRGFNSITTGVISYQGRVMGGQLYDQISNIGAHGSSGCGVFKMDGSYIGMLVRGGEGFNLIVPIRRMLDWAKRNNAEWVFNPAIPANDDFTFPVENYMEAPSVSHLNDEDTSNCRFMMNWSYGLDD